MNKHDDHWSPPIWVLSLGAGLAPFAVTLVAPGLEYSDMEAFKACDAIWQKSGEEFFEKYGELYVDVKFNAYRGQVFQDWS